MKTYWTSNVHAARLALNDRTVLSVTDITSCLHDASKGLDQSNLYATYRARWEFDGIRLLRFWDRSLSIMQTDACRLNI